ncbi:retinol dehydrogenase 12-like [Antedon mediterranea]|uniref:retinol dehydrogenase 12-like n=1 Tax=Antedon mediterranea TaxID=105859 RepID=UPI003AF5CA45
MTSLAIACVLILMLRRRLVRKRYCSNTRLDGKVVIITGANTGIGKETARDLVRRGAKVILACRDVTKGKRAVDEILTESSGKGVGALTVERLDLASFKSIRSFAKLIIEKESPVNILINNAGVSMCSPQKTTDGFELQFGVNHLGHFLLTHLLLDVIKSSAPSRIITVSSFAHRQGKIHFDDINLTADNYAPLKAYRQSKLANIMFTNELARMLKGTNVTCYSLHPGLVSTEICRYLSPIKRVVATILLPLIASTSEMGAQTTIYCAVEQSLDDENGYFYSDCERMEPAPQARDEEADKQLWKVSAEMVKLYAKE